MSIVLVGSTSGSVTLQEPAVSGSTVLTLPAVTGNVLTDTSPKTGNVIQVVQGTLSSNFSSSSNVFTAIGATLSITPSSSSSRILLIASVGTVVNASNFVDMSIFRNSTNLAGQFGFLSTYSSAVDLTACQNFSHIDSPATTSAISYSIRMRSQSSITYSVVGGTGQSCTLIAMEIAG
jgi:hypothetical protein